MKGVLYDFTNIVITFLFIDNFDNNSIHNQLLDDVGSIHWPQRQENNLS